MRTTGVSSKHLKKEHNLNANSEIKIDQLVINCLVDGSAGGSLGMFELTVLPGSNVPPPHSHSLNEKCIYVPEGKLRYSVGEDTRDLVSGDPMLSPKGVAHRFSNPFDAVTRALIVQLPDIGAQYFKDIGAIVNGGGPPDKAALVAVMPQYGLVSTALSGA